MYTTNIPVLMLVKTDREAREALRLGAQECLAPEPEGDALHAAIQKHLLEELDFTSPPAEVLEAPAHRGWRASCAVSATASMPRSATT